MNLPGTASAAGRPTLVLVVDDNPDTLEMYALGLQYEGFDVLTADDGDLALKIAIARCPDCIVTDLRMPSMTGFEFRRFLALESETADIPVIALTGYGTHAAVNAASNGGFAAVLLKPCVPEVLAREIVKVLAISRRAHTRANDANARATQVLAKAAGLDDPLAQRPRADQL